MHESEVTRLGLNKDTTRQEHGYLTDTRRDKAAFELIIKDYVLVLQSRQCLANHGNFVKA